MAYKAVDGDFVQGRNVGREVPVNWSSLTGKIDQICVYNNKMETASLIGWVGGLGRRLRRPMTTIMVITRRTMPATTPPTAGPMRDVLRLYTRRWMIGKIFKDIGNADNHLPRSKGDSCTRSGASSRPRR